LSYGTTVNHVLGLEVVDEFGEVFTTNVDDSGYDLTGALVGSEGTLGVVTSAWVRLLKMPESVRVWVAAFTDVEAASEAVSAIIGSGIVPTALEMMDDVIIKLCEEMYHSGFPTDAGAVLMIENAGIEDDMDGYEEKIERLCKQCGSISWRSARTAAERDKLWAARKGAFGATGRIAPNCYLQDVVVPRTKLPQMLTFVENAAKSHDLPIGNVFHAGDGNLHPLLMYDRRDKRQVEAVKNAGNEILSAAVDLGGTISGEHGIGYEKRDTLPRIFNEDDLGAMLRVRDVFDAKRNFNPDKIFPASASCEEVR
jgi:glycolate oxidase